MRKCKMHKSNLGSPVYHTPRYVQVKCTLCSIELHDNVTNALVDLLNVQVMEGGAIHVWASISLFLYHDANATRRTWPTERTTTRTHNGEFSKALHSTRIECREFLRSSRTDAPSNFTAFLRP